MIRVSLKGVVMQDSMVGHCAKVNDKIIKTVCWFCKQPVVGSITPDWPGSYSMECKNCGHSAFSYYDNAALNGDEPRPMRDLNPFAQIIFKRLSDFLERIRVSRLLIDDFNQPVVTAHVADSPGGFVLTAEMQILDRPITLKQYYGSAPARINAAVGMVRQFCDEQRLELVGLEQR